MKTADPVLLDLPPFLQALRGERQTSMLIHGAPLCGKSHFGKQLVEKMDGGYLSVLDFVSKRTELIEKIDEFDPTTLRQLILEFAESNPKDIIVIDDLDFLFPLWVGDLMPFQDMVYRLYNPKRQTTFVFFVQTRPEWKNWKMHTSGHQSRVVFFDDLKAL